jgi:hypothetical protein
LAFADVIDIASALEQESLSAAAEAAATQRLDTATAVICAAAGETDEAWFAGLSTTQQDLIKGLTVELVCRAMASPQGLTSATETLGAHSRSETYRRDLSTAMLLTPQEEAQIKRIAGTAVSGSVRLRSLVHDVYVREAEDVA